MGLSLRKREPRRDVLVPARMRTDSGWVDVKIRNMSAHGLMFRTTVPPSPGTVIEIRRQSIVIIGRAVWRSGPSCGVRTQDILDIDAIVAARPATAPARADGSGLPERRTGPRGTPEEREARARALSSAMQYGAIVGGILIAAAIAMMLVHQTLGRVSAAVTSAL